MTRSIVRPLCDSWAPCIWLLIVESAFHWQPLFCKHFLESFFELEDPQSVLNGLSGNGTLIVICSRASPGEPNFDQFLFISFPGSTSCKTSSEPVWLKYAHSFIIRSIIRYKMVKQYSCGRTVRQGAVPKGSATAENLHKLGYRDGDIVYRCNKCLCIKPERAHHCRSCLDCLSCQLP